MLDIYIAFWLPVYDDVINSVPTMYTFRLGVGHLITVIIGAGVLSLPKAFSLLGWLFGPILLIFFGIVSLWTSMMLSQIYEVDGKKHKTYKGAVFHILGAGHRNILATVLYIKMWVIYSGLMVWMV